MSTILNNLLKNSKDEKSFIATEDLIKFAKDRYHMLNTNDEESYVRVIYAVDVYYSCGHHQLYYCNYDGDVDAMGKLNADDVKIVAPLKDFCNYYKVYHDCYDMFNEECSFEDIYPLSIGTSNEYHKKNEITYDKDTVYAYIIVGTKHLNYKCALCATKGENKETLMSILDTYNVSVCEKIAKDLDKLCIYRGSLGRLFVEPITKVYSCGCEAEDNEEYEDCDYYSSNQIEIRNDKKKDVLINLDIELSKLKIDNSINLSISDIIIIYDKEEKRFISNVDISQTVTVTDKELCDNCYKVQQIKEQNDFSRFDSMLLSHGLATGYSGKVTINDCIDRAYAIYQNPDWEICCSNYTQKIGAFGFVCKGENTFVSCHDVWSRLNALGQRVFNVNSNDEEDSICYDRLKYVHNIITKQYDHSEHFVKNVQIQYFWIKKWAIGNRSRCIITEKACEELRTILRNLGYDLKIVSRRNAD